MHPWSPQVTACPYQHYDRWRADAPVAWSDDLRAWLVLGYEEASFVLEHDDIFSSANSIFAPGASGVDAFPSPINLDDPRHARVRTTIDASFTDRGVERDWAAVARRAVDERLEDLSVAAVDEDERGVSAGTFDAVADFAFPVSVNVTATMLGVSAKKHEWFGRTAAALAAGLGAQMHEDAEAASNYFRALAGLRAYFEDHADASTGEGRSTLLARLTASENGHAPMSGDELQALLALTTITATAPVTSLITTAVRALAETPTMLERIREDRGLVWNLVEEALRFDAPIQGLYRRARENVDLGGSEIAAGDALCVLYGAANRDPRYAECPSTFSLDSARSDHLAFGRGTHACVGANLARIEAEVAINGVLDRFETLEPLAASEADIRWRPATFLRGMASYRVAYTLRTVPRRSAATSAYRRG
jgi:cytochrome P450